MKPPLRPLVPAGFLLFFLCSGQGSTHPLGTHDGGVDNNEIEVGQERPIAAVARAKRAKSRSIQRQARQQDDKDSYQPKRITVIEGLPSKKTYDMMTLPAGSPWCRGRPTYWPAGHQFQGETPWCQQPDGAWTQENLAIMDTRDELNSADPDPNNVTGFRIDRHGCTDLVVGKNKTNQAGNPYIVCLVGANDGKGKGFAELYETQQDGSIRKILRHGMQNYPTMRAKYVKVLRGANNNDEMFVIVTVRGGPREDGAYNEHTLFKVLQEPDTGEFASPYFERVPDFPSYQNWRCECAHVVDINGDGLDDLVLCSAGGSYKKSQIFLQGRGGSWNKVKIDGADANAEDNCRGWQSVRVGKILGGPQLDMVVVGYRNIRGSNRYFLRIFEGIRESPYFNFTQAAYELNLDHEAPDVELLQVNGGRRDIYVVQDNTTDPAGYCGYRGGRFNNPKHFWGGTADPPADWIAPVDSARDLLLIGKGRRGAERFEIVTMRHAYPGCGSRVARFGNRRTMILAQSDSKHAGYSLLLEW